MDWTIILGYIGLLVIQIFALQSIPAGIFGALFGQFRLLGILIGSLLTWYLLDLAWLNIFGHHLPLLAFVISILFQSYHLAKSKKELTESSKFMIEGEMIAILFIGLYILIFKQFNWY